MGKRKKPEVLSLDPIPKQVKVCLSNVGFALTRDGMKLQKLMDIFHQSGYEVGQRTLERWLSQRKEDKPIFAEDDSRGREPLLSPVQLELLVGYVLDKNDRGRPVSRSKCQTFLRKAFALDISLQRISEYLQKGGLTLQMMGTRQLVTVKTYEEYVNKYVGWIQRHHEEGFFLCKRKNLASIDFMSNSQRKVRETTYSPRGAKQRKFIGPKSKYTDCYLTLLWSDGINRTPALLFTYNPALDPDGDNRENVLKWCAEMRISPSRIYYTKSKKLYYAEDSGMVQTVLSKYDSNVSWKEVHMMRDAGNSFKVKGQDIFEDGWSKQVAVYEPVCHGELSPNGNSFHATAKNIWRNGKHQYASEAEQALYLLSLCDRVSRSQVKKNFEDNLRLSRKGRSFKEIEAMLKPRKAQTKEALAGYKAARARFQKWKDEK